MLHELASDIGRAPKYRACREAMFKIQALFKKSFPDENGIVLIRNIFSVKTLLLEYKDLKQISPSTLLRAIRKSFKGGFMSLSKSPCVLLSFNRPESLKLLKSLAASDMEQVVGEMIKSDDASTNKEFYNKYIVFGIGVYPDPDDDRTLFNYGFCTVDGKMTISKVCREFSEKTD